MYSLKANTVIRVYAPFNKVNGPADSGAYFDTAPWKLYTTKEDQYLEKHEVIDIVAVHNKRDDTNQTWIRENVLDGWVVLKRENSKGEIVYALIKHDNP